MTGPGPSTFGALLRGWRERALLTQEELGRRSGVDPRTLRRWETGKAVRPHGSSLRQVAETLGLDDDESAELAAAARGSGRPAAIPDRPRQLPAAPSHFVGRDEELAGLRAQVAAGRSVIAVEGMAGVGKTAFAIQAARLLAPDFPDGQLFLDLHGFSDRTRPLGPDEALARLIRSLGVPGDQLPVELEEAAGLFRSLVADRRLLLVYDNVATAGQVTPLLPATATCQVITTSRHTLAGLDRDATVRLDTLSRAAAADLFARASESVERAGPGSDQLTEAVELCGRLPLALRIAAARLRSRPSWQLSDLVLRLREQRATVLDRLDDENLGVSTALDLSYAALDEPTRRAFRLIGLIPGPDLDADAAGALFGTGSAARSALETLQDLHLLDEAPVGRYAPHDLTRAHAAERVRATETEADRSAALIRLFDHYCAWASGAMDLAHPYTRSRRPDPPYAVDTATWTTDRANGWLEAELPNLLAAARAAHEAGSHRHVLDLAGVVHRWLIMRNRLGEADILHRLALRSAEELGDRAAAARAHRDLGRVRRHQQDYPAAAHHYDQALTLAAAEGLTLVAVDAQIELAATAPYGGRSELAPDDRIGRALRLAQDAGDELGQLEGHTAVAHARLNQGAYRSAADHYDRALALARQIGYRAREVNALIGRGRADAELGRTTAAVAGFRRAVALARTERLPVGELAGLYNLGNAVRRGGDPSAALDSYREVLEIAQRTGSRNWEYEAHQGMGRAQVELGDGRSAREHHDQARLLAERRALPIDLARAEDGLGDAYAVLGDPAQAKRHWQSALDLLAELGVDHTDDPETGRAAITAKLRGEPASS